MPVARQAFGYTYYSYSLHDWRQLRSLRDIPREHWSILQRPATNHERRNRIDFRDGAVPQLGGVDHIGAGFEDRIGLDTGAELLTEYGLNPNNTRASWHAAGDSDTLCLLAPPDTRPWVHGVAGSPFDLNSYGIGFEDGIQSTNWNALPEPKRTAHLRMRAAFWALFFGDPDLGWELKYTDNAAAVWDHIRNGRSWGLTQHGIMDWANRTDAGLLWAGGGTKVNTMPYEKELLPMIREEMKIRAGGTVSTPGLPAASETVTKMQAVLNEYGYNLDLDGSFGPLTMTAALEVAADTDYTGDVADVAAFTKHLEDTMSKLLDAINEVPANVWRHSIGRENVAARSWLRGGNLKAGNAAIAAQEAAVTIAGQDTAIKALTEALATQQDIDPEQLAGAVRGAVAAALADLKADVTLTIAEPEENA